jgi:hypothetical protein
MLAVCFRTVVHCTIYVDRRPCHNQQNYGVLSAFSWLKRALKSLSLQPSFIRYGITRRLGMACLGNVGIPFLLFVINNISFLRSESFIAKFLLCCGELTLKDPLFSKLLTWQFKGDMVIPSPPCANNRSQRVLAKKVLLLFPEVYTK